MAKAPTYNLYRNTFDAGTNQRGLLFDKPGSIAHIHIHHVANAIRQAVLKSYDDFSQKHPGDLAVPLAHVRDAVNAWYSANGLIVP